MFKCSVERSPFWMLLIPGTGNGERGTGNGERGRGTGNGEPGTGVWERVYSGNPLENSKWRTKEKKIVRKCRKGEFLSAVC